MNKYKGGALRDNRSKIKKFFSPQHPYSGLINWSSTPTIPGKVPVQRNQEGSPDSSSCVAQSKQSCIYANLGIITSAQPIFSRRLNFPTEGMYLYDADQLMVSTGTNLESLIPSEHLNDMQLDLASSFPTPIKATGKGVTVQIDADHIADAINLAKAVSVTFESNEQEWDHENFTPVYQGTPTTFGHCICLYGYFMNQGVKTFIATDSDGQWSSPTGLRYITESFLVKRATGCSYNLSFIDTTFPIAPTIPVQPLLVKDPMNVYPNMKPESVAWWTNFWNFLKRK